MTRPAVELRDVSVQFGQTRALADLTVDVARGETLALLGPSGSGKSTALKVIAGFLTPRTGRVLLDGRDVTAHPPHKRGIGVVVQNYALFPHLRVFDNVAFGLRARRMSTSDIRARVAEVLALVGMSGYAKRFPRQLSGGQQQRVAIARALAIRPAVLLLDEPLSALDAALREDMLAELIRLRRELPDTAIVFVTHDQAEALALADRIAVMRDAKLVDVGPAEDLYHRPRIEFTAAFLGAANLVPVDVLHAPVGAPATVRFGGTELRADPTVPVRLGDRARLGVRPHRIEVTADVGTPATLVGIQWRGSIYRVDITLADGTTLRAEMSTVDGMPTVGNAVGVRIPDGCPLLVDGRPAPGPEIAAPRSADRTESLSAKETTRDESECRTTPRGGDRVESLPGKDLAVQDTARTHPVDGAESVGGSR